MVKIIDKIKSKKGQDLVEMAMILPVIILFIGIIITVGQLMSVKIVCQIAAYEGARKGIVQEENYVGAREANKAAKSFVEENAIGIDKTSIKTGFSGETSTWWTNWHKGGLLNYQVSVDAIPLFPIINENFKFEKRVKIVGQTAVMVENDGRNN